MRIVPLVALLLCLVTVAVAPVSAETTRVVCIGDSITQGRKGNDKHAPTFSYRYPLWKMCVDAGLDVDFVGSMREGFGGSPDWADYKGKSFDRDHEGHWGWTSWKIAEELPGWIEGYTPDVALIMLGTNGTKKVDDPIVANVAAFRSIIATLRKKNPRVVVILGQTFQEWAPFPAMRQAMDKLAAELSTETSPVLTVDHSPGWVSKPDKPDTHTVDWVHPNPKGDARIAERFFESIKPHVK